ncbi:MAG: hypothetical protein K6G24_13695 [Lachnospiraceae bacterium]|nr:hypothetical protein [Lachnospiraceae bacterium]
MAHNNKNEENCFDYIRGELFRKEALDYSYEAYGEDRILLSKRPMASFFAMTKQDIEIVEDAFFKAIPNDDPSRFPDFTFDGGFIEHFQITSSEVTKVGAGYKKAFSQYENELEKEVVKQLQDEMNKEPSFGKIKTVEKAFSYKGKHSHDNLIMSLKQSVDKHIRSEISYGGTKTTKIFLIEYNELSLKVQIDYPDVKPERMYGDLLRRENVTEYRMSRDKEALRYLYEKRDYIDYVVYATDYLFEIIKVEDIAEIIKLLVYEYEFHPVMLTTMSCMYGASFPRNIDENEY